MGDEKCFSFCCFVFSWFSLSKYPLLVNSLFVVPIMVLLQKYTNQCMLYIYIYRDLWKIKHKRLININVSIFVHSQFCVWHHFVNGILLYRMILTIHLMLRSITTTKRNLFDRKLIENVRCDLGFLGFLVLENIPLVAPKITCSSTVFLR